MSDAIIGHERILDFFTRAIENNALSHAYCFVGPSGVGKRTVAETIAAQLFGVERKALIRMPDFTVIERAVDEKTEKLKKDISIAQIRDLVERMTRSTFMKGGYKIAIIDHAEYLNAEAGNALLKTLEEPTDRTVLFLIAENESQLLPTVRSRCQTLYFSIVPESAIQTGLQNRGVSLSDAERLSREAHGLPGRAIEWVEAPETYAARKEDAQLFYGLFGVPLFEKMKRIEFLFGDKTDHIRARDTLQNTLDVWTEALHEIVCGSETVALPYDRIISIQQEIRRAEDLLGKNIHPKLVIEHILLQLP